MAISHDLANAQALLEQYRRRDGVDYRPSSPKPEHVAAPELSMAPATPPAALLGSVAAARLRGPAIPKTIRAYPSLLVAFLQGNMAPAGRIWLLLQALDPAGSGSVDLAEAARLLTDKRSKWRVVGRRRLNQLLRAGEGVLWTVADGRIWLKSPAKIAPKLGLARLSGNPIKLPTRALLGSIGTVKAHFYAAYESGRRSDNPISRAALADATSIPERTQRHYDGLLTRTARKNIVVTGRPYQVGEVQELAHELRRPIFPFIDWVGLQGRKRAKVCAFRIADSRSLSHAVAARGRQRKVNSAITLVCNLERGNERKAIDRTYHPTAEAAAAAYNRDQTVKRLWPAGGGLTPNAKRPAKLDGVQTWGVLMP